LTSARLSLQNKRKSKPDSAWLGLLPLLLFCLVFEIIPVILLVRGSLMSNSGEITVNNYLAMGSKLYIRSFWNSIRLSGITAFLGTVLGVMIGYAIYRLPSRRIREGLIALSDVTTNFAGAPLAFAFIVVLGSSGVVTLAFERYLGIKIYPTFSIYSFSGLILAYLYFQLPLMVLLSIPAFVGLRPDWWEAAQGLGATSWYYWRRIAIPVLFPTIIAGFVLLFANSFGAYATAFTLAGTNMSLVTIQIAFTITGEVLREPGLGDAMATLSLIIMSACIGLYQWLTLRSRRWQNR
jgi:putative spermidine/putrescine transport system permease protein